MNFEDFDFDDFYEWAENNGYDVDNELNREEAPFKRSVRVIFFMKKKDADSYAQVSFLQDYDWGASDFEVMEGLRRIEEVVTITKVKYV